MLALSGFQNARDLEVSKDARTKNRRSHERVSQCGPAKLGQGLIPSEVVVVVWYLVLLELVVGAQLLVRQIELLPIPERHLVQHPRHLRRRRVVSLSVGAAARAPHTRTAGGGGAGVADCYGAGAAAAYGLRRKLLCATVCVHGF